MKKILATLTMTFLIMSVAVATASAEQYEVKEGDSLWKIADKNETTIQNLIDINGLGSTVIHPNDVININVTSTYTVKKGDTLGSIAKEFGVTVKEIKKWNKLTSDIINIDQELDLQGAAASQTEEVSENAAEPAEKTETEEPEQPVEKQETEKPVKKEETKKAPAKEDSSDEALEGKKLSVSATAYTAKCDGCSGVTATGLDLNNDPNAKVIAVDPSVIPLGSKVHVEGYGEAIAADTGGAIKGNKIDVHVPTKDKALQWGRRTVEITVLGK